MIKRLFIILFLLLCVPVFAERKLTTNEALKLAIGPFFDSTDGITPETGIDVTGLTVEIYREFDADTTPTRFANFVPTASGGSNDMVLIGSSVSGMYSLEVTAAQLNFTGAMILTIVDTDSAGIVGLPFWRYFDLTSANVVDAGYGTDNLQVDTTQIEGADATGRLDTAADTVTVTSIGNNVITTLSINDGAITDVKIATIGVNVVSEDNIDFGALKKASLDTAADSVILADTDHTINSLTIDDDTGDALTIITRGGNGNAISVTGDGSGAGVLFTGGATGHGLSALGGASGGQGINALAQGGNGAGVLFQGQGSGSGLDVRGGATGYGQQAIGGASSGAGIYAYAQANNDAGMKLIKHGTGKDLDADELLTTQQVEDEAIDALESFKLDELMKEGVTTSLQTAVHDNSVIGYMLARANVTNFARDDDSLQGIAEGAAGGGATAQQVWEYNISAISAGGLAGTIVNDVPSTSEFQARTLATGDYFLFGSDAVANVTLVNGLGTDVVNAGAVADAAWQELIELFFDFDATATYSTANAGSVVKQITDNATVTLPPRIY